MDDLFPHNLCICSRILFHSYIGGVALEGGSHSTTTFINRFILCIMRYPEVQRRAQMEIDNVLGTERLPQLEDVTNMPYVQAIIKEVWLKSASSQVFIHVIVIFSYGVSD